MSNLPVYAVRQLAATPEVVALVGSDLTFGPWLFRWKVGAVTVEGSSSAAVVMAVRGGWATPNRHNTARFPRLQAEVYADLDRNLEGNPIVRTAEERAGDVYDALNLVFHRPDAKGFYWGNDSGRLRIVSSVAGDEPTVDEVPGGDGMVRLVGTWQVVLG